MSKPAAQSEHIWGTESRPFSLAEVVADGVVHGVGLLIATVLGSILIVLAAFEAAPGDLPAIVVYVASLLGVLAISLAFNLSPVSPAKHVLARLDQAAIFLFIAATYTPFLASISGTMAGDILMAVVWGASLAGIALKLVVPRRFRRIAIVLYLGIGWSGILVFQALAATLPPMALWLLLAGGVTYSVGIVFHLWERLKFNNVLWHGFVVLGATLHLLAILDCMALGRL